MKQVDKPVIAAAKERLERVLGRFTKPGREEIAAALLQFEEACQMQTQWLRAKERASLGRELAEVLCVADDVSWPTLLQYVGGMVRANATARKRRTRRKAGANPRKARK